MLTALSALAHAVILAALSLWFGALDAQTMLLIAIVGVWTGAEASVQAAPDTSSDRPSTVLGWALLATMVAAVTERGEGLWVGAVLLGLGVALRVVAVHTLGSSFITGPAHHGTPVQHGLYRWLRHPSEVGNLLIAAGVVWLSGSLIAAAIALFAVLPLVLWRVHREDRWWLTLGSADHRDYVRRVPAFIPGRRLP